MFNFFNRKEKNNSDNAKENNDLDDAKEKNNYDDAIQQIISGQHPNVQKEFDIDLFKLYAKGVGNTTEVAMWLDLVSQIQYLYDDIKELKELIASKND